MSIAERPRLLLVNAPQSIAASAGHTMTVQKAGIVQGKRVVSVVFRMLIAKGLPCFFVLLLFAGLVALETLASVISMNSSLAREASKLVWIVVVGAAAR